MLENVTYTENLTSLETLIYKGSHFIDFQAL